MSASGPMLAVTEKQEIQHVRGGYLAERTKVHGPPNGWMVEPEVALVPAHRISRCKNEQCLSEIESCGHLVSDHVG